MYLLTNDINVNELPPMFEADKELFKYLPNNNLKIEGERRNAGKFIAFISPQNVQITY
ncbi:hypothetical protein [Ferruginibacter sp.]|uniref:hypothetical protein n=1 Tax=Ferruginibacter sp. TaxID=1940288 RepID=UPI00199E5B4D|nr:hypothetical protein [Ferruginibacter sp.]MBC7625938.1 hypothetical protein [Ferruginibacter sp.]